ncbi:Dihydrofolate reductase [Thioalkalivibrio nitratireducens DSM 14787]|uniref:Dihydrofolate reductase n=1 Tax=Thioalkalivibrio nitratireducens (strain DSM 14787 / UNIQEM 213 / ALEN2) TaxID=1255043 RepID=L0DUR0_THIND|nr:dihydrofolate reductase [Thioalkalivibrio nitratireducens]AGA32758.1 Dihydrofolate reductase [Thioalkalivibrio nitratireducens DSM 14787]
MRDPDGIDPRLEIIVAMDPDRVIGRDNALPWHLPDDLRHFRRLTTGHTVVMGRRTHESIGRPLPDRRNLVLTRQPGWAAPGVEVFAAFEEALAAADSGRVFVIGGAELFKAALPRAAVLHLTRVHDRHPGDVRFPAFGDDWTLVWEEDHPPDERHSSGFTFQRLERSA